jgi:hypothetical protein
MPSGSVIVPLGGYAIAAEETKTSDDDRRHEDQWVCWISMWQTGPFTTAFNGLMLPPSKFPAREDRHARSTKNDRL